MKKVSIVIPCYNEEDNIVQITNAVSSQMQLLPQYDYEILCIDNCSTDNTRPLLRKICEHNKKVKAIFNIANFGQFNSPYYALCQSDGDCTILICADFQDPVEMIPVFLKHWEEGYYVVCGVKTSSKENPLMYKLRSIYYRLIKKFSAVNQIEHFTGFALYDRKFVDVLRELNDPTPFLRGIVAEYGGNVLKIPYEQQRRQGGRTHNNFFTLFDAAMLSVTSYTKAGMRFMEFIGAFSALFSLGTGLIYLILKLIYWDEFITGQAPVIIIVSFMFSVILAFLGFLGEYIAAINTRIIHRPLVIEEERINFDG